MVDASPDDDYIKALAALGTVRSYAKNTILVQEGDRSDQVYVVLAGKLKVYLADSEGKEIIVNMLGVGQYFGEMALEGDPRSASVMTLEPSRLSIVEREQFKRFLASNPEAAYALIVTLIRRARNLTRAVGDLALLDVYGRVARLLLENAREENGPTVVTQRMTQQEIGRRVGASREMVWRILDDLRQGGYIGLQDGRIVICQPLPKRW
ncbi:MAG: cyclic nucleotide-binding domain-containing protein [Burkholderiales bacterium]|nr:cyclic nucleotide-binding domain-containing protein [Burkholderiales bacterium]